MYLREREREREREYYRDGNKEEFINGCEKLET